MVDEEKNRMISAAGTAVFTALLLVFLLLCGFTRQVPPPPSPDEMELVEIDLDMEESGGGNMMLGGNSGPEQKSTPEVRATTTPQPTSSAKPSGHTVTDPTGAQTHVPTTPTPDPNASFTMDKVAQPNASNAGGNTSGKGAGDHKGDGLGLVNDPGSGGGRNGGTGGGWVRKPKLPNISVSEDVKVYLDFDVDENGNVSNIRRSMKKGYNTTTTDSKIINACIAELTKAQFQAGHPGSRTFYFTLTK
ncbi:MAG: hypothetical protein J5642_06540 [Bacteroidales bacterium]|nr:hypothetical protein [Bacteroidales bacterium]